MKRMFHLLAMMFALAALIACGGSSEDTAAKKEEMSKPAMMEDGGYEAMAVTDGGSITGMVTVSGTIPPRTKLDITKDVSVCGQDPHYAEDIVAGDDGALANVIVSITDISSGKAMDAMGSEFTLDQHGCTFVPHITMVPTGADLTILNSDGILHNIHTYSEANPPINVAQPGFRKQMKQSFDNPEVIRVACDVHNWMGGYISVVAHPYHAVSGKDGSFEISDVPPGTYTIKMWHEKLGEKTMEVTVAAGAAASANAEYTIGS